MGKQMGQHHSGYFGPMRRTTHRIQSVLLCAFVCNLKLEHLRLEDVNWDELFSFADVREESKYFKVLSHTISARLPETYAWDKATNFWPDWGSVLSQAVDTVLKVKSFSLRIGGVDFWGESSEERALISTFGFFALSPTGASDITLGGIHYNYRRPR